MSGEEGIRLALLSGFNLSSWHVLCTGFTALRGVDGDIMILRAVDIHLTQRPTLPYICTVTFFHIFNIASPQLQSVSQLSSSLMPLLFCTSISIHVITCKCED